MILAHQVVAPSELARSWTFEPTLVVLLVLTGFVYARGSARLRRRIAGPGRPWRTVSLWAGLAVVAVALLSPLDALAATLFSAHMVQHLLLMVVAAPMLVYARPTAALVAGLPGAGREAVHRAGTLGLRTAARRLTNPVVVWAVGAVALWTWHMPSLYELALEHDLVHAVEHASFLGAGVLFWSLVVGSGVRRGVARPVALGLMFANGAQSTALGAVLVFASTALYPLHAAGADAWGMSLLEDQQLAGALMWGPPAVVYLVAMGWLLVRWFAEMEEASAEQELVAVGGRP